MERLSIPLELAELLHATLGPLSDALSEESHPWAPLVRKALDTYISGRDTFLVQEHGAHVLPEIEEATRQACTRVDELLTETVSEEEDFTKWGSELSGEEKT